ncbi:hypothetical protein Bsph_1605 [Lysinibacillus sphaericus C3-41]|uniref:Uncharacterized protein n=1 Tax=Lysinibacillus sphaericus (strain C3-41) TaxID=444177 RepID=B1HR11_LYSSC|nr:hypothetical protein Bsph_1605 [Lysinibacillus sphaericus C3-41]
MRIMVKIPATILFSLNILLNIQLHLLTINFVFTFHKLK